MMKLACIEIREQPKKTGQIDLWKVVKTNKLKSMHRNLKLKLGHKNQPRKTVI